MTGLRNVIGLLYRADWTRLSLSAEVRLERDGDLELGGYSSGRAALLIAPGGRYRLEHGDEPEYVRGSDGERGWAWRPGLAASPALAEADDEPPLPELLCPSSLLGGFTLDALGP